MSATHTIADARELLRSRFGYPDFRPGQERAVQAVLEKRDTLVILPTGGGKSLCFQVPALMLPGLTVVISPLISLMKDQVDALTARSLPATFINSSLSGAEVSSRLARAERGEVKLLYVAPERFDVGTTAERLHDRFPSLTKERSDRFGMRSQQKVAAAYAAGKIQPDLIPVAIKSEAGWGLATEDEGMRPETTMEGLATLKTPFRPHGRVTAGNASPLTDGATVSLLASQDAAKELGLSVKTVEAHKANAMRKLGLTGRIDIVKYAVLQGWLDNA